VTKSLIIFFLSAVALSAGAAVQSSSSEAHMPGVAELEKMTARLAPVEIEADISKLPASEKGALVKMINAAYIMDALFLRQVWAGNENLLLQLSKDDSALGRARLRYFLINKGPWSRLDGNKPFIPGVPDKPEGANFYPSDATKQQVENWLKFLPDNERDLAAGFFTALRRSESGGKGFMPVPYNVEYQGELQLAAGLLREAASLTSQPSLKDYLSSRAQALTGNDYYDSDIAWMELDATIEPTIGPYEVYEDEWFNAKAAFEAFITIRDDVETAKLEKLGSELQDIEDHLPVDPIYRNPKLGGLAPIRVVNEILAAGDANHGVQTAAFNLPNDDRIVKEKGSKRVMLKNVQEAKFRLVLLPISRITLSSTDRKKVSFDAFFSHIVMHELMHGLGPHEIHIGDRISTVRQELKDTYSAIEEAKADITGLFALRYLVDKGVLDKKLEQTMYDTFLASAFRSIRFGLTEAHARGIAIQLNYLLDYGALLSRPDGTFVVNHSKIKEGVTALTGEIITLEGQGNYEKARDMLSRLSVVRPEIQHVLDRLNDVPVDIKPKFTTAERLLAE
jgi:hypothetical protein